MMRDSRVDVVKPDLQQVLRLNKIFGLEDDVMHDYIVENRRDRDLELD